MVTKYVKVMSDLEGYFKKGQREAIYNAISIAYDDERKLAYERALNRLLWVSGRRVSEIIIAKVHDINFDKNRMLFNILKKGSKKKREQGLPKAKMNYQAYKYLDNDTIAILKYHIVVNELNDDDWLFPHTTNNRLPITRHMVHKRVRKYCKIAGIEMVGNKKPHAHCYRHSVAVELAENSRSPKDIRVIQQLLEHSSLDVTQVYLQFNNKDVRELYQRAGYRVDINPDEID